MEQLAPGSASEGTLPGLTSWASAGRVAALPIPQGGGAEPDTVARQWSVCCLSPLPRKIMSWTHRGPASQLPPQEITARSLHGPYSPGAAPTDCGGTPRIRPRSPGLRLLRDSPASARSSGQTPGAHRRRHAPHAPDLPCGLSSRAARLLLPRDPCCKSARSAPRACHCLETEPEPLPLCWKLSGGPA